MKVNTFYITNTATLKCNLFDNFCPIGHVDSLLKGGTDVNTPEILVSQIVSSFPEERSSLIQAKTIKKIKL